MDNNLDTITSSYIDTHKDSLSFHPGGIIKGQVFNDTQVYQDRSLIKINFKSEFSKVEDITNVLYHFYNFYFKGEGNDSYKLHDLLFSVLKIADIHSDLVDLFNYETDSDKFVTIEIKPIPKQDDLYEFQGVKYEEALDTAQFLDSNLISSDVFYKYVKGILDDQKDKDVIGEKLISVINISAYLTLTFYRAAAKDQKSLVKTFVRSNYISNLRKLLGLDSSFTLTPPCNLAIMKAMSCCDKSVNMTRYLFYLVITSYITHSGLSPIKPNPNDVRLERVAFLCSALLTHTSFNGMGVFKCLSEICKHCNIHWTEIFRRSFMLDTKESWEQIGDFYSTQLSSSNPQNAFPWGRILHDANFKVLALTYNRSLSSILFGMLSCFNSSDIWEAKWCVNTGAKDSVFCRLGKQIYYVLTTPDLANANQETKALLVKAMKEADKVNNIKEESIQDMELQIDSDSDNDENEDN